MIKESLFAGENQYGPTVLPLFSRSTDTYFEKCASAQIMPEVLKYIETVKPQDDCCYTLVNALGASEYYSSNVNADAFPEAALIHRPDRWAGDPALDSAKGKAWAYGYPTFYGSHVYPHHRNKDPLKSLGDVEFATWNHRMKRVELVTKVVRNRALANGGQAIWDKLKEGIYADVSMGAKVPFDTCAICLDWATYREAQATYRPGQHAHEGIAVLEFHKKVRPIRGLAITRADYCQCMRTMMNKILPDGRKVFVYNDYPKFFDISYVFIGADRTAKSLIHIARPGFLSTPTVLFSEKFSHVGLGQDKTAEAKVSELKESEIYKTDIPSQFVPAAVNALSRTDRDLPRDVIHMLAKHPPADALLSAGCMGIVLRPREFQRMMLVGEGECGLADRLEDKGVVFPRCTDSQAHEGAVGELVQDLLEVLLPYVGQRSALRPSLLERISVRGMSTKFAEKESTTPSLLSEPLRKISAAYSAYRSNLMEIIAHAPALFSSLDAHGVSTVGKKLASSSVEELFSEMTVEYVKSAFWDEVAPTPIFKQAVAGVQTGFLPTKTTRT